MLITDAHVHIYSADEARYPMIAQPLRPPAGCGSVEHLQREMAAAGVARAVAVQVHTAYRWDNRLLVDSARANAGWLAGVCTMNPLDAESPALLRRLVEECGVRGMRSVAVDDACLGHPGVEALWTAAERLGIPLNVNVTVKFADEMERLLRRHPGLPVIIDHCMYPRGKDGLAGEVMPRILRLAAYPNLYAKLTWLASGSDQAYPFADTYGQLRAVVDAFGPARCVWGSSFPTELWQPQASYATHLALFSTALGLTDGERDAILSTTPGRLYFGE
jgi:L-fuconolactonase